MAFKTKAERNGLEYFVCPIGLIYNTRTDLEELLQKPPVYIPVAVNVAYCNQKLCSRYEECPTYNAMLDRLVVETKLLLGVLEKEEKEKL